LIKLFTQAHWSHSHLTL